MTRGVDRVDDGTFSGEAGGRERTGILYGVQGSETWRHVTETASQSAALAQLSGSGGAEQAELG